MLDDEIDSQKPLPWGYPGEVIAYRRHSRAASQESKVKVRLAQEMWIVDGELTVPWLRFQDGTGARGLAMPTPIVVEKGSEVEVTMEPERPE